MWITYLEIIESIRKKVTIWLLQLVDKGRGTVYPTVGPAGGVPVWRSPGHRRARDCMPATDTRPQHTCLPLSALCLESLTLSPCHRKNIQQHASSVRTLLGYVISGQQEWRRREGMRVDTTRYLYSWSQYRCSVVRNGDQTGTGLHSLGWSIRVGEGVTSLLLSISWLVC